MQTVRLNSEGQITIPMPFRKQLRLQKGDDVSLRLEGRNIIIFPKHNMIESAFGLLQAENSVSTEDMKRAIRVRAGRDCD